LDIDIIIITCYHNYDYYCYNIGNNDYIYIRLLKNIEMIENDYSCYHKNDCNYYICNLVAIYSRFLCTIFSINNINFIFIVTFYIPRNDYKLFIILNCSNCNHFHGNM